LIQLKHKLNLFSQIGKALPLAKTDLYCHVEDFK